jgi:hypothetical protein
VDQPRFLRHFRQQISLMMWFEQAQLAQIVLNVMGALHGVLHWFLASADEGYAEAQLPSTHVRAMFDHPEKCLSKRKSERCSSICAIRRLSPSAIRELMRRFREGKTAARAGGGARNPRYAAFTGI